MKFKSIVLPLFTLLMLLSSCKKFVTDISPEYEGEWHSAPVIDIDSIDREKYFIIDGKQGLLGVWCELAPLGHNCSRVFRGDVKFNYNKSKFTIGPRRAQVALDIDVPPHINADGDWECTLTERVYIRN